MLMSTVPDRSNGYEAIAEDFTRARTPTIGPRVVRKWAKGLPRGAAILDIGCGFGIPISQALLEDGFAVCGVDASPTLVARFRERFPDVHVECCPVEDSLFFSRTFDAVVAWGLMFLLPRDVQRSLIGKVARTLKPQGQFLFTSPKEVCTWTDGMTGLPSVSIGHDAYRQELTSHGLKLVGNDQDEGENYYYITVKL
ncbi:MAG TPA: class I SAM-dependent methyltransferase [Terriglobia bacterium]|nr:class I SAM-dependent methyltransferase [Terriglobia bacterium]